MGWAQDINWEALSAIGTVAAVWFAIVQANRSHRAERMKADGILTMLIACVEPVAEFCPRPDPDYEPELLRQDAEFALPIVHRAQQILASLAPIDVASVGASQFVSALPMVLDRIADDLKVLAEGRSETGIYSSDVRYVEEAEAFMVRQRQVLRYGRLGRHVALALRRAENWYLDRGVQRIIADEEKRQRAPIN